MSKKAHIFCFVSETKNTNKIFTTDKSARQIVWRYWESATLSHFLDNAKMQWNSSCSCSFHFSSTVWRKKSALRSFESIIPIDGRWLQKKREFANEIKLMDWQAKALRIYCQKVVHIKVLFACQTITDFVFWMYFNMLNQPIMDLTDVSIWEQL